MNKKIISLIALMAFSMDLYSQSNSQAPVDADKRFEEALKAKMKKDREMIERFMNDDLFKQFDKMFENMARDFDQGHFKGLQKFFEKGHFDTFLGESGLFENLGLGDGKWIENRQEKILVLKIARKKEEPLNIEIKDGVVRVSGVVITKKKRVGSNGQIEIEQGERKVERTFNIPSDVDAAHPKFENKDESILIRFSKKSAPTDSSDHQERRPVSPSDTDLTI